MDKENHLIKLCVACGCEREYNDYHRLYDPCKKCAKLRSAKYYQKNRERILSKSRLYRENNRDKYKRNRQTVNSHTEDIQDLYKQINMLTQMMKTSTLVN